VLLVGVNLLGCTQHRVAQCDFRGKSQRVEVGTTQTVKVGTDAGPSYIDFAGFLWASASHPGVTWSTLPPAGAEVRITLVSQEPGSLGTARAQLADGSTVELGVPGCA
jgi:hypothetical protein